MTVYTFEASDVLVDYSATADTIQFPEELIKTFDYESTNSVSPVFNEFLAVAEDITAGTAVDIKYIKLNEAMGQIGLGQVISSLDRLQVSTAAPAVRQVIGV